MIWMFLTSSKSNDDYLNNSTWSLPTTWEWGNYTEAWTTGPHRFLRPTACLPSSPHWR
ncbi:hypothetical protein SALBM135S_03698 [Streptomyces alboniger]